ncbi:cysteine dioxygenase family protein [Pseudomonas typographi]|uniref:Cysteine dioxygenase n=1 Tax=Pseudomonas typographi TaxID=2715964 RepID=A0ABR7YX05_9PSED|nr:cysteine dioxygenase family protein [Pseudomonas typographi]MBD1586261.1 cysteine dioxygenase [Pseudomonas typographi]MBD1597733.1 cysteine dioxygenase [Pseudomonas typographi]
MSHPRAAVIQGFLEQIRAIDAAGVDRAALGRITALLEGLTAHTELFNFDEFPPPAPGQGKSAFRYRLNDDGEGPTLYLNSLLPGKRTVAHNHETWAVIVAVQGQELNTVYQREDDGSDPTLARLAVARQVVVQPGTPISFLGDDLHSIQVDGQTPTLHFHLYGRPLESLEGRYGVQDDGRVVAYNKSQMEPSIEAYGQ